MTGRNAFLVAYDVCDKKRLRQVHKKMRGFGDPLQYSVFRCELSSQEKELMVGALSDIIHHEKDRILIIDLGPARGQSRQRVMFLGHPKEEPDDGPVVF